MGTKKGRSKNLSIMLTDMQGYTVTSSSSSRQEIIEMIQNHNKLMMPIFDFYGGTIIKTIGDAFLVTFDSATDAVVCGIVIQLILKEYNQNLQENQALLNLRVVINTGDVALEQNDIYGEGVNITARMESLDCMEAGMIGISQSTQLLLNRNEIFSELLGEFDLKGIPYPVQIYNVPIDRQNIANVPVRLLKIAEKIAGTSKGMDQYIGEWNDAVQGYLEEGVASRLYEVKMGIADQTKTAFDDLRSRKEALNSGIRDNLDRQKKELTEGLQKGMDRIKSFTKKKE
jgi:class 3 adenylate cyclase